LSIPQAVKDANEDLDGVYLPHVVTIFELSFVKMGNAHVTMNYNMRKETWEVRVQGAAVCRVRMPSPESFLPWDNSTSYHQTLEKLGKEDIEEVATVMLLSPPDTALLDVGEQHKLWLQRSEADLIPSIDESSSEIDEGPGITLSDAEVSCVHDARLSFVALQNMAARGISAVEVAAARTVNTMEKKFLNPVRAFNDHLSCCRDDYTVKARLVGDDEIDGVQVFFALRQDTLEILPFPTSKLLLPGTGGESQRAIRLQEVMVQANNPPGSHDEDDDANVRLLFDVDSNGERCICKCVQEKHFLTHLDDLCPKILLCGWAPCQLVLMVSRDCNTILDVLRLYESSSDDPSLSRVCDEPGHPLLRHLASLSDDIAGCSSSN